MRRARESARLITRFEDVRGLVTKRGARSLFMVDKSIGYHTAGLSAVMHELAPGMYQSRHRHGGEAWLYVVSGNGYSEIDGVQLRWEAGDLIVVDHWQWHQHFNDEHGADGAAGPRPQLRRPVRHDADPAGPAEPVRGAARRSTRPTSSGVVWPDHLEGRPEA